MKEFSLKKTLIGLGLIVVAFIGYKYVMRLPTENIPVIHTATELKQIYTDPIGLYTLEYPKTWTLLSVPNEFWVGFRIAEDVSVLVHPTGIPYTDTVDPNGPSFSFGDVDGFPTKKSVSLRPAYNARGYYISLGESRGKDISLFVMVTESLKNKLEQQLPSIEEMVRSIRIDNTKIPMMEEKLWEG